MNRLTTCTIRMNILFTVYLEDDTASFMAFAHVLVRYSQHALYACAVDAPKVTHTRVRGGVRGVEGMWPISALRTTTVSAILRKGSALLRRVFALMRKVSTVSSHDAHVRTTCEISKLIRMSVYA